MAIGAASRGEWRPTVFRQDIEPSAPTNAVRTTVSLEHKNIPGGGDNTDPTEYPQHAFVIIKDQLTGEETIVRGGPGGQGGNFVFGSIRAVTTPNVPGSTLDYGAQVNASQLLMTSFDAPDQLIQQMTAFTDAVNAAQIGYNPLASNSNSVAYQASQVLIGRRPATGRIWAPAASTELMAGGGW